MPMYWFRFHTGSIKSEAEDEFIRDFLSFDSILVRLKDTRVYRKPDPDTPFRFHTGSIKSGFTFVNLLLNYVSFDSILVRLKDTTSRMGISR